MADRNLLFGILALQMDFISRDQLVAAMHAWVLDKARPLGETLVAQGALTADRRLLLEALVGEHLKMPGSDPQQSLAALNPVGSARHALAQIADTDLSANLAHVSAGRDAADRSPTLSTSPPAEGERFRILRPHARGGLGEVYVARDFELAREVALKEIQPRYADDPGSRARFVLEAEITGGLEHPGIVPVYSFGQYPDGRPFYAMRLIKGASLHEAIERLHQGPTGDPAERERQLRQLLRRFHDVCNTVEYAHSRGVLHRDLKPGNIMLGKYGETLVVDWGLAKPVSRPKETAPSGTGADEGTLRPASADSSAETLSGSALGTPAYMSPEQAAGRLDLLGPASDVYSLGATLYCLCTGRAPFTDKAAADVLARVQRGDFPRPRKVQPGLPPPLEAICLKAMAHRQEDRYPSAAELARDVERWLDDAPVSAWPEPWTVRTRRWMARHRTLVTASAGLVLVALVGLGITTLLLNSAYDSERQAREQAGAKGLALSTDGKRLAIPWGSKVHLWDLEKGPQPLLLEGHLDPVTAVAFSPDGKRLATAAGKGLRLWDVEYGVETLLLCGHAGSITAIAFSRDGTRLASASDDGTVHVWEAPKLPANPDP
jgi:serine/threonine-protein kinase